MKHANWIGRLLMGLTAALFTHAALAQTAAMQDAPAAAAADETTHAETTLEGKKAYERLTAALKKYRAFNSYQDELEVRINIKLKEGAPLPLPAEQTFTGSAAVRRPNYINAEATDVRLVGDGEHLFNAVEMLQQYRKRQQDGALMLTRDDEFAGDFIDQYPSLQLVLAPSDDPAKVFSDIKQYIGVEMREIDGKKYDGVRMAVDPGEIPIEDATLEVVWLFDADQGLLRRIEVDMTKIYQQMIGMQMGPEAADAIESVVVHASMNNIKVDEPIAADMFKFTTSANMKEVEEFEFSMPGGEDQKDTTSLKGQDAPAVVGKTLDGKDFDLAKLKGRVVLIDFWATWCGPCVKAIPHIQKLHEKYADKQVSIVGINQDGENVKAVKKFVDAKKLTFTQVLDPKDAIARNWLVMGIPTTVIVDPAGKIHSVRVGFAPSELEEITKEIDELLKSAAG